MDARHPPADIRVDADLARALLAEQHPDLLAGETTLVDEGWDNATYRVGPDHAMRIPRREVAVDLIRNEQRWLPWIAPWLSLSVPLPVAVGEPSATFPWPWSVVPWIQGATPPAGGLSRDDAETLAVDLRSLHRPAPHDAPLNPFRGVPLGERAAAVVERLAGVDDPRLEELWRRALEAAPADEAVWLHGDLHPRNVLVHEGRLVGLIDWGDLCAGDAATDLACAWMLFDASGRAAFRRAYAPSDACWTRAAGWAVNFGTALLHSGERRHEVIGRVVLGELVGVT
jgi:aminoglycoside phosphotransferase (APT) family kinase protein